SLTESIELPQTIVGVCKATAEMYEQSGYSPPWIGYVAIANGTAIGAGAFVGVPNQGRVEIAYFTLPEREGEGMASRTARQLVTIAKSHSPELELFAKTRPQRSASTTILKRLGFVRSGTTI